MSIKNIQSLFELSTNIESRVDAVIHWMNSDTYATEPGSQVGIYNILCKKTNKIIYIGKTDRSFQERWNEHRAHLSQGTHHSAELQRYFDSLNRDFTKIKFEILQELPNDKQTLNFRERYWIHKHPNVLNTIKFKNSILEERYKPASINTSLTEGKEKMGFHIITKEVAAQIHEYLYSSIKINDQEKAPLIAGILIALENDSFRSIYENIIDADQFIDSFMSAIKSSITKFEGLQNGKEQIISIFDYIKYNQNLRNPVEYEGTKYVPLQLLTKTINKSIYNIAKAQPTYDILGEFYNEFTRRSGSDQQSLGIVLTPHHIANFMSELLEINDDDVILDTCAGSASLLLTAEQNNLKPNKVVGIEFNARMLSLAVANIMIRDIPSFLMLGDSWDPKIIQHIETQKPTKMIINPPYSQNGYPELGFIKKGLDSLASGGLAVAIVPMSAAIKNDSQTQSLKKDILEKHTLLATFSMPDQLFYPAAGVSTIIMLFKAHEAHSGQTFLGYLKDDGYIVKRGIARMDEKGNWARIKNNIVTLFHNMEPQAGFTTVEELSFDVDWSSEEYLETDYTKISNITLTKSIKNLLTFIVQKEGDPNV